MISMIPNIPHNYANFFHRVIEQLAIYFIIFINYFQPRQEVSLIKDWSGTIIFDPISNTCNKRTFFKDMIDIFNIMIAQITPIWNSHPSGRQKIISR